MIWATFVSLPSLSTGIKRKLWSVPTVNTLVWLRYWQTLRMRILTKSSLQVLGWPLSNCHDFTLLSSEPVYSRSPVPLDTAIARIISVCWLALPRSIPCNLPCTWVRNSCLSAPAEKNCCAIGSKHNAVTAPWCNSSLELCKIAVRSAFTWKLDTKPWLSPTTSQFPSDDTASVVAWLIVKALSFWLSVVCKILFKRILPIQSPSLWFWYAHTSKYSG